MLQRYVELSKAQIQDKRFAVISKNETSGGYTLAQQLIIQEGKKQTGIFFKGAMHLSGLESLYELRDALNAAIEKEELLLLNVNKN